MGKTPQANVRFMVAPVQLFVLQVMRVARQVHSDITVVLVLLLLIIGVTLRANRNEFWTAVDRNVQMIKLLPVILESVQENGFIVKSTRLIALEQELVQRATANEMLAHPVLALLSMWDGDLKAAQHWSRVSSVIWQRFVDTSTGWHTKSLISFGQPFWSYSRQMLVDTAWLVGNEYHAREQHSEALHWFQRGLSLAPGRVPQDVRLAYYQSLSAWYFEQPETPENNILATKFACLAEGDQECLSTVLAEKPMRELPHWHIAAADFGILSAKNDLQLVGFDLDEDIIGAGADVAGYIYWRKGRHNVVQTESQLFVVPNLAPNPGFEFQDLYNDACVDGYIGSHAFVSRCVSGVEADPLKQRDSNVVTTQTAETGYLLIGSPAKAESGQLYVVGAQLCSLAGANTRIGIQFTSDSDSIIMQNAYSGLWWPLTAPSVGGEACWSPLARVVLAPTDVDTVRVWLGGFGESKLDTLQTQAMFDNVFVFDLSELPDHVVE